MKNHRSTNDKEVDFTVYLKMSMSLSSKIRQMRATERMWITICNRSVIIYAMMRRSIRNQI